MTAAFQHRDLGFRCSQDQPAQRQMPSIPSFLPVGVAGRMIGGGKHTGEYVRSPWATVTAPRGGTFFMAREPRRMSRCRQTVCRAVPMLHARACCVGASIVLSAVARSNRLILDNIRTRPRSGNAATDLNLVPRAPPAFD